MKFTFTNTLLFLSIIILSVKGQAQVYINELSNMNRNTVYNDEEDAEDWIELFNSSNETISLKGWTITDNPNNLHKWVFPEISIKPKSYVTLFASGKEQLNALVDHWESLVYSYDTWSYFQGTYEPPANWNKNDFNDAAWKKGTGGFGYGNDTCINTFVQEGVKSVYTRISFNLNDINDIVRGVLHLDFSDGFIAYLNGTEIARKNMSGSRPAFDEYANASNKASLQEGIAPQGIYLEQNLLWKTLQKGKNTLAIQVHKSKYGSGKLASTSFFTLGFKKSENQYKALPLWMNPGGTYYDLNFKLTAGEEVILSDYYGNTMDSYIVPELQTDHSAGRSPDGGNNFCIFEKATPGNSNNGSKCYEGYEPPPLFSLEGGFFTGKQSLEIVPQTTGSYICYTLDGGTPEPSSLKATGSIPVNQTRVVSARCFSQINKLPSMVVKETYFINENSSLPVFSISTDSSNLWDYHTGILAYGPNASERWPYRGANFWQRWEREAHIEFYNKDRIKEFSLTAGLRVHGGDSRGWDQKSLRIHCRGSYGAPQIDYPIIKDKEHINSYKRLVLRNGGSDFRNTRFRDAFIQRLMKHCHLDYLGYEPAIVFLNGSYWGLYGIRERVDKHYLISNFNFPHNSEFDILEYHGSLIIKEGSDKHFLNTHNTIMSLDPKKEDYYNQVNDLWDLENFADFFIIQTFTYNYDWLLDFWTSNMKFWRRANADSKWRFFLVDVDFGLGLAEYTEPDHNTLDLARNPYIPNPLSELFDRILENQEFRNYFINRYADLMNTNLHLQNIKHSLTGFVDEIEQEMPRHTERWNYSLERWYNALSRLEWFTENRIDYARQNVQNEFKLPKQVNVTLDAFPEGAGEIKISTIIPDSLPWTGIYYDGVPVTITAIANEGYKFKRWEPNTLLQQAEHSASITLEISSDDTFTALFEQKPEDEKVEQEKEDFSVQVFPNPAREYMTVNIDTNEDDLDSLIEIFDFTGRKLNEYKLIGVSRLTLYKENYNHGIYFLKCSQQDKVLLKKIIFN